MNVVFGFVPWIVYWVLVGNVDFRLAVTVAFALALAAPVLNRLRGQPVHALDVGSAIVFAVLMVAAYAGSDDWLERWLQPLSNAGLLLIVLAGLLIGRPFVRDYAAASADEATARSDGFRVITVAMTWMWAVAFGVMLVSSLIPPIADGDATIRDMDDTLSILFYWVIPFVALGIAGAISAAFPPWFEKRSAEVDRRTAAEASLAAQPEAPADLADAGLAIDAPGDSRHDQPFPLAVRGAPGGSAIEVATSGRDLHGREWRSSAAFAVPPDGVVDLAAAAPQPGPEGADWTTADDGAPVWSMRFAETGAVPELFVPPAEPWQLTVAARVLGDSAGAPRARRTVLRRSAADGVRLEPVELDGLPGMLALPAGAPEGGGWPAVGCFGGSEGGFESQIGHAALLASRGYAALAQAWIAEADAADGSAEVPLERFGDALRLLAGHERVDPSRVAAMAISRGAEGLLAAVARGLAPPLRALVLVSPGCVTWQAMGSSGEVPDTSSWTAGGEPVPWVPLSSGVLMGQIVRNAWRVGRDTARHQPSLLRLRPAYESSLAAAGLLAGGAHARRADRAPAPPGSVIDAARVDCPLLMLAGSDDQVWPSGPMADLLARARQEAGRDADDELVAYEGAGHLIRLGLLPTDAPWTGGIALGGEREGLARAQADAVRRVLEFLDRHTAAAG